RLADLEPHQAAWVRTNRFTAGQGQVLLVPDDGGALACVLFGLGNGDTPDRLIIGKLPGLLPQGTYRFAARLPEPQLGALAWALGAYRFDRYHGTDRPECRLVVPE